MKPFLAIIVSFTLLTAYAQTTPGTDLMDTQIRRGLAARPDPNLLTPRQEQPNEVRRNGRSYSGILVQLARTDKPLELINPAAPAGYGSSEDNVVPGPPSGRGGLKLFSIRF